MMETPHMFRQCLRHTVRSNAHRQPLRSHRQYSPPQSSYLPTFTQSGKRGLSSSAKRLQEASNQADASSRVSDATREEIPPTNAGNKNSGARSSTSPQSRPNQKSRPREPHRHNKDIGRIDLSSIPGMPSSYRPPNRPDEATAQAKLRSLLGAAAPRPSPSSRNPRDPQDTTTASQPTSSLDAYANPFPNQRTQPSTPNLDIADLIANIDRPNNGNNNGLDFLSGTSSNNPQSAETLRLGSSLGRTINITPASGFDLTRAFRQLDLRCTANSVRRDEASQRFHVRRGQAKKIRRRQRWRVLFKEGFLAECARVRRMRAQGW